VSASRNLLTAVTIGLLASIVPAGCQSQRHTIVEPKPGTKVICQQCYDEVAKVRRRSGHRGPTYTQNVSVHQCPQCETAVSIYSENGVLMVKCDRCAPEGLACDKCLPPRER
jgi:Zn ribbon nucleic-acid-binding protein